MREAPVPIPCGALAPQQPTVNAFPARGSGRSTRLAWASGERIEILLSATPRQLRAGALSTVSPSLLRFAERGKMQRVSGAPRLFPFTLSTPRECGAGHPPRASVTGRPPPARLAPPADFLGGVRR